MAVIELNGENFQQKALGAAQPALVDFWAPWCGPCRMQGPVVEQLASEMEGKAVVGKVNVDENPDLASQYGVMSIPTLIVFKDGKEADRRTGVTSKDALVSLLESAGK